MEKKKIGSFISQLRKEKNLTQFQLSQKIGISDKAISKWERGKSLPEVKMLIPLSRELEISIEELLLGEYTEK